MNGERRDEPGIRPAVALTTTDTGRLARRRVQGIDRRRRVCGEAERLMPLARYYAGPPLLAVPIGEYYVRGR